MPDESRLPFWREETGPWAAVIVSSPRRRDGPPWPFVQWRCPHPLSGKSKGLGGVQPAPHVDAGWATAAESERPKDLKDRLPPFCCMIIVPHRSTRSGCHAAGPLVPPVLFRLPDTTRTRI